MNLLAAARLALAQGISLATPAKDEEKDKVKEEDEDGEPMDEDSDDQSSKEDKTEVKDIKMNGEAKKEEPAEPSVKKEVEVQDNKVSCSFINPFYIMVPHKQN